MTSKKLFTIKDPSSKSSVEASFSMTLKRTVTKTHKPGDHWQPIYLLYEGGSTTRILKANQAMGITATRKVSVMSSVA